MFWKKITKTWGINIDTEINIKMLSNQMSTFLQRQPVVTKIITGQNVAYNICNCENKFVVLLGVWQAKVINYNFFAGKI